MPTIRMTFERSTKNTHVYVARPENPVTQLYVQKTALGSPAPQQIEVTIQEVAVL